MINLSKQNLDFIPVGSTTINTTIDVAENKIILKCVGDEGTLFAFKIDINDIQNRADFYEQTIWAIDAEAIYEYNKIVLEEGEDAYYDVDQQFIINLLKNSLPTKNSKITTINIIQYGPQMFFPYDNNTADDIIFKVYNKDGVTTFNSSSEINNASLASWKDLFATPTVDSIDVLEDMVIFNVSVDQNISQVYVGQDSGSVVKTKVPVVNGVASIKILKSGLETGDTIAAKIGYKYFSNALTVSTIL